MIAMAGRRALGLSWRDPLPPSSVSIIRQFWPLGCRGPPPGRLLGRPWLLLGRVGPKPETVNNLNIDPTTMGATTKGRV